MLQLKIFLFHLLPLAAFAWPLPHPLLSSFLHPPSIHPRLAPPFYSNSNDVRFSAQFQSRPHFQVQNGISSKPEGTVTKLKPKPSTLKETEARQASLSRGIRHYPDFYSNSHAPNNPYQQKNHPRPPTKVLKLLVLTPFFKVSKELQLLFFPKRERLRPHHYNSYESKPFSRDHDHDHYYGGEEEYDPFPPVSNPSTSLYPVTILEESERAGEDEEEDNSNYNYFHLQDIIKPQQEKTEGSRHLYHPHHHPGHIYAPSMLHQKYELVKGVKNAKAQKSPIALKYAPSMDHKYYSLSKDSLFSKNQNHEKKLA